QQRGLDVGVDGHEAGAHEAAQRMADVEDVAVVERRAERPSIEWPWIRRPRERRSAYVCRKLSRTPTKLWKAWKKPRLTERKLMLWPAKLPSAKPSGTAVPPKLLAVSCEQSAVGAQANMR